METIALEHREVDAPPGPRLAVPLELESPRISAAAQPLTVGVPFPRGALRDTAALCLLNPDGEVMGVQTEPLAHWPDGSVQWLLLDLLLPSAAAGVRRLTLAEPAGGYAPPASRLRVEETPRAFVIETGAAVFHVGRERLAPLSQVEVDGRNLLDGRSCVALTTARGRRAQPRIDSLVVETRGPVRTTLRAEGGFGGTPCSFVARLCFFAAIGLVRLRLTIRNPQRARHASGLWDLGDSGSFLFRELALELGLGQVERPCLSWWTDPTKTPRIGLSHELEIYQASSGGDNWQSRTHVNRDGGISSGFRGYRVRALGTEEAGLRASPIVVLGGVEGSVALGIPEFWQQFPRAISVEDGLLRAGLFPRQWEERFELQGGEQKTHTVWLHFGRSGSVAANPLDWVHSPASLRAAPEWTRAATTLPIPGSSIPRSLEKMLERAVVGPTSLVASREIVDEFGWRNFGDVYADHEGAYYKGPAPVISHYNNQYDIIQGGILQYLRTGDRRWFALLDPLARHVIDIDLYHTERDRAAYNGGLFWHTDHYKDAATCTHRAYSAANCGALGKRYGGGPSDEHNYTTGLLHYHYLTGDPQARDAVLSLADWVVQMDDGRLNLLGLVDDGPTGLASQTADPGYHGPGRGAGNSVNALLDGWLLSGKRGYLEKAEELIRRVIHPADDIDARDLLNVEARWSYTVFLVTLARYLALKAEQGELDEHYAYGRASLVHYASWMREHEKPYLDQREKLEYPTEVWAAQDLRKANVLRLAATHVDEPLRSRLLDRGQELADRAWHDLLAFESRDVARARALVMIEGTRDAYFRGQPLASAERPQRDYDFGQPQAFVPQKQRVLRQFKDPRGLVRAILHLARPRTLARIIRLAHRRRGGR